tara:strand:+ start:447 stop:845 length:399 start_codon:yes stop_codon:yes gene_type:complete
MSLRLIKNRRLAALLIFTKMTKGFLVTLFFTAIVHNAAADARLIMVTSEHCPYCQAWERDVGAVFNKSPYAAKLPLTRVEIGSRIPKNISIKKPIIGTPTFLITRNGQEIDRQRGYVDEEIFYLWLSEHMAE